MTTRTETFPTVWIDVLIERRCNFELHRPDANATPKPLPAYVTDGRRTIRVRCVAQTSPFSRARLIDFRLVEKVTE